MPQGREAGSVFVAERMCGYGCLRLLFAALWSDPVAFAANTRQEDALAHTNARVHSGPLSAVSTWTPLRNAYNLPAHTPPATDPCFIWERFPIPFCPLFPVLTRCHRAVCAWPLRRRPGALRRWGAAPCRVRASVCAHPSQQLASRARASPSTERQPRARGGRERGACARGRPCATTAAA